ncbi:MAG TPA: HK97 family phage prohead protease [Flavisolibacter sp.]|nr:HK97 family phage prohead protease [Flavisolibacter sp.]
MENIYQYKNISFELKDLDTKEGIVKGYFSAFNVKDSDGDIILPGAFTKSIKERGPQSQRPRIKWLIDHDTTQVPGVIKELSEDSYGLAYVGKVGTHNLGQDFLKMVESGIITEHSIGFKTIEEKKRDNANYMHVLHLMEGSSLKTWGANEYTPITGIKSEIEPEKLAVRIKRLEKFVKNTDATDECIESLIIEIKQLSQLLIDTLTASPCTTPAAQPAQEPEKEVTKEQDAILLHLITKNFNGI